MKTDDQKDEYAQRVNHEKEDRVALLERLKKEERASDTMCRLYGETGHLGIWWHERKQTITDAITALSAAPSGCAEAGERDGNVRVKAKDFAVEWCCAMKQADNTQERLEEMIYKLLVTSPSPAGGADGERVDWLEENAETHWPFKCAYTFWVNVETQEPFLVRPTIRQAIDAAIAATQATPAKDSK